MDFKQFYENAARVYRFFEEVDFNWLLCTNIDRLVPLHLIEANLDPEDKVRHPKYQILGGGDTNPKTAKHPVTQQTYMSAVLHLEPYLASGHQTCPFATAIYKIVIGNIDPQTLNLISNSPGYEADGQNHTFYGFELRSSGMGKLGDTLLSPEQQDQCPARMRLRLPGASLRDWNTGATIELNRNQILGTKSVGGCANACLHTAGDPAFAKEKLQGRRRKTHELKQSPKLFMAKILLDMFRLVASSEEQGHKAAIRLNATSDEAWESASYRFPEDRLETENLLLQSWPSKFVGKLSNSIKSTIGSNARSFKDLVSDVAAAASGKTLFEIFKTVQFYDYTKIPSRMSMYLKSRNGQGSSWPENYHLTFSLAESNRKLAKQFLEDGGTVSVVFNVLTSATSKGPLPQTWGGFPVLDADQHDYRFLDATGHVAGLRAKGEAKFQDTDFGFVVQPDDPDLDPKDPAVIQAKKYAKDFEERVKSGELRSQPGSKRQMMRNAGEKLNLPVIY